MALNSFERTKLHERARILAWVSGHLTAKAQKQTTDDRDGRLKANVLNELALEFKNIAGDIEDGIVHGADYMASVAFSRSMLVLDTVILAEMAIEVCERDERLDRYDDRRAENPLIKHLKNKATNIRGFYAVEARK